MREDKSAYVRSVVDPTVFTGVCMDEFYLNRLLHPIGYGEKEIESILQKNEESRTGCIDYGFYPGRRE